MNRISKLLLFICLALVLTSCKKEEEFSVIGSWDIPGGNWKLYDKNGVLEEEKDFVDLGRIRFETSGKGNLIKTNKDPEPFTWSMEGDNITITGIFFYGYAFNELIYKVKDKSTDKFYLENSSPVSGGHYTQNLKVNMKRV